MPFTHMYRALLIALLLSLVIIIIYSLRSGYVGPNNFIRLRTSEQITYRPYTTYSSNSWNQLAQKYASEGEYKKAKTATLKSLIADPTNGGSIILLANLYGREEKYTENKQLIALSKKLWPSTLFKLEKQQLELQAKLLLDAKIGRLRSGHASFLKDRVKNINKRYTSQPNIAKQKINKAKKINKQELNKKIQEFKHLSQKNLKIHINALKRNYD